MMGTAGFRGKPEICGDLVIIQTVQISKLGDFEYIPDAGDDAIGVLLERHCLDPHDKLVKLPKELLYHISGSIRPVNPCRQPARVI